MTAHSTPPSSTIQAFPKVRFNAAPHFWEMVFGIVVACVAVVGSLTVLGKWYFNKSAENSKNAAEAREAETKLHQLQFKMILKSLENQNAEFTDQEKQKYTSLLQDITYEDVKSLLDSIHYNEDRRDLNLLIQGNQVERAGGVDGLRWNNGKPAQIRFIKKRNPLLDFRKIDVSSADSDPCSSKVIPLGNSSNVTVEICESHLGERLEIIVIQP